MELINTQKEFLNAQKEWKEIRKKQEMNDGRFQYH